MPEESTPAVPVKQKAWVAARKGTPAKAVELQDIDVPKLVKGEVLVKVQAGALNPGCVSINATRFRYLTLTSLDTERTK